MLANVGMIENRFGLLEGHTKLVPEKLREFMMPTVSAQELASKLNVGRGSLYKPKLGIDTAFLRERILPLVISADLAFHVFHDMEKAREWMTSPNAYFFGQTPTDICLRGAGQGVIELLNKHMPKPDAEAR